jgi:CRISPR-associated protein Csb2
MPSLLKISVRFLLDEFDGRGDGGEPEWPPSPLRLFQTLTNSAARLGMDAFAPSLEHLEKLPPPRIAASKRAAVQPRFGATFYVPNNDGDLWFDKAGKSGGKRVEKNFRPTRLPENAAAHYIWEINDAAPSQFIDNIRQLARAVSSFGWGVNMVVADADAVEPDATLDSFENSEKWLPSENGGTALRVPVVGTLAALKIRHQAFLGRLPTDESGQFFRPVPPLETFRIVTYRRENDLARPPYAIFALRKPNDSGFAAFDPQWRRLHLTGMLRHTASRPDFAAALGWNEGKVTAFVLGHDSSDPNHAKPTANAPRLVFIPLPSIEWRGEERGRAIGSIRRVLVTVNGHCELSEFQRIVRALEGRELIDEKNKRTIAFLRQQSGKDQAIADYFAESATWTTATPVVLPGHDDPGKLRRRLRDGAAPLSVSEKEQVIRKLDARIERLLRKALLDAGLPAPLLAKADLQWRSTGFIPGTTLASHYSVPDQCRRFRRLHVHIVWRERAPNGELCPIKLAGPLCVGNGRFSGLGLFIPMPAG